MQFGPTGGTLDTGTFGVGGRVGGGADGSLEEGVVPSWEGPEGGVGPDGALIRGYNK